ncbi:MAG: alpha/beta hydrolase-fold protein [Terricaulis sp.]
MRNKRWLLAGIALAALLFLIGVRFIAPRSNILLLPRAHNGTEYVLYVHVPDRCKGGGCPALYILDGDLWLPTFTQLSEDAAARHAMAPVILVGIGYRNILASARLRKHDFSPAFGRAPGATGGADAYIDTLRRDIIPYAEAHLPIDSTTRGIAGHSYGGLLASYTLMHTPELFDRYLIMSPALWFDGGKIFDVPLAAAPHARAVYLASNSENTQTSQMTRDVRRLNALLLTDHSIELSQSVFLNKSHNGVVEPAARAALPQLFPDE